MKMHGGISLTSDEEIKDVIHINTDVNRISFQFYNNFSIHMNHKQARDLLDLLVNSLLKSIEIKVGSKVDLGDSL